MNHIVININMEIVNLQEVYTPTKSKFNAMPPKHPNELGRGSFSTVILDSKNPHIIIKTQIRNTDMDLCDLFENYVDIIIKNELWNMVHFPKIFSVNKINDDSGHILYEWGIEKLLPMSDSSIEKDDIILLCKQYFNPTICEKLKNEKYHRYAIADTMEELIKNKNWEAFKDLTLQNAVKTLNKIHNTLTSKYSTTVFMDIHGENIMFRRTADGLELIFSDPFVRECDPEISK